MTHPHACLLFVAFVAGTVLLGWWGARCAEQGNDALLRREGLL